ncbi:hypothetical protein M0Q50_04425 [bacterium]|jgi:hypothetical protein|nr:hypothetical protein [bacterium]
MSKKDDKYGNYYQELVKYEDGIYFNDIQKTNKLVKKMFDCGVTEVYVDVKDGTDYSDTLFFGTDKYTNFKELMSIIMTIRPDEFSEETPYHYRMWFD